MKQATEKVYIGYNNNKKEEGKPIGLAFGCNFRVTELRLFESSREKGLTKSKKDLQERLLLRYKEHDHCGEISAQDHSKGKVPGRMPAGHIGHVKA